MILGSYIEKNCSQLLTQLKINFDFKIYTIN